MSNVWSALLLLSLCTTGAAQVPQRSRQLVVVTTAGWTESSGHLLRFERAGKGGWRPIGTTLDVVVGHAGLGWGRGLHLMPAQASPIKREGDGRAPAGLFYVGRAFGRRLFKTKLPFLQTNARSVCVDDPAAAQYNQLVEAPIGVAPWRSSEALFESDFYGLAVVLRHNDTPVIKGAGSCIFLHVWLAGGATVGCTALSKEHLEVVVRWLDPAAMPVWVQLPRPLYKLHQAAWGLLPLESIPVGEVRP